MQLDKAALASRPRAPSFHHRAHELSPTDRRRLLLAADSLTVLHPPATVTGFKPPRPRRIRLSSRTSPPVEARGPRHSRDAAPPARYPAQDRRNRRRRTATPRGWPATTAGFSSWARVSDEQLVDLFAGALACRSCPCRKTTGWSWSKRSTRRKPVVTCVDSGEPLHFVKHGVNGLRRRARPPTPWLLRSSSRSIIRSAPPQWATTGSGPSRTSGGTRSRRRSLARRDLGDGATQHRLVIGPGPGRGASAHRHAASEAGPRRLKVAVLDMQPIHPAVGGGRLRLLGLYHELGAHLSHNLRWDLRLARPRLPRSPADPDASRDRRPAERSALCGVGRLAPADRRQDGDRRVVPDAGPSFTRVRAGGESRGLRRGCRGVFASVGLSDRTRRAGPARPAPRLRRA